MCYFALPYNKSLSSVFTTVSFCLVFWVLKEKSDFLCNCKKLKRFQNFVSVAVIVTGLYVPDFTLGYSGRMLYVVT
jgi:hypothetical protein